MFEQILQNLSKGKVLLLKSVRRQGKTVATATLWLYGRKWVLETCPDGVYQERIISQADAYSIIQSYIEGIQGCTSARALLLRKISEANVLLAS